MRDKTILPEKWLAYSNIGDRIAGTVFVAFKVPLDEKFNSSIREVDRFTPAHLMRSRPDLGLVIDLTNTLRYYNPEAIENYGAKHRKVACPGQMVPTANLVKRFCAIVDDFIHARIPGRPLIGVHCTHGVNRTGYMICSYMIRHLGIPAADAMLAFETARGYHIERVEYVAALLELNTKDVHDPGVGLGRLLRHPRMFQLGTLTEAPTPPDSRAGTSSSRTIPTPLGATSDLCINPALAAATVAAAAMASNPSAALSNACPLTAVTAPPPAPSETEKIVLVHATPPLKKKKKASAGASVPAAPGLKSKVKKRKKSDAEGGKADPKSPQGPAAVRQSSRSSSTTAPPGAGVSSPVKERRAAATIATTAAVLASSPHFVEESASPRSPSGRRGRGRGRLRKRGRGREQAVGNRTDPKGGGASGAGGACGASGVGGVGDGVRSQSRGSEEPQTAASEGVNAAVAGPRPGRRRCGRGGGRSGKREVRATKGVAAADMDTTVKQSPASLPAPPAAPTAAPVAASATAAALLPCNTTANMSASSARALCGRGRGRGRGRGGIASAGGRGRSAAKEKRAVPATPPAGSTVAAPPDAPLPVSAPAPVVSRQKEQPGD